MTFYKAVTRDWGKWGLAQQRLALSQCQSNNNWAGMRTRGRRRGWKYVGMFQTDSWIFYAFCLKLPFTSNQDRSSSKTCKFSVKSPSWCLSLCLRFLIFHQVWKFQPTDFLSFHWLKSLGNLLWAIVTPRGWRDNRQLLKMFCTAVSLVSDCYVEWKF